MNVVPSVRSPNVYPFARASSKHANPYSPPTLVTGRAFTVIRAEDTTPCERSCGLNVAVYHASQFSRVMWTSKTPPVNVLELVALENGENQLSFASVNVSTSGFSEKTRSSCFDSPAVRV